MTTSIHLREYYALYVDFWAQKFDFLPYVMCCRYAGKTGGKNKVAPRRGRNSKDAQWAPLRDLIMYCTTGADTVGSEEFLEEKYNFEE